MKKGILLIIFLISGFAMAQTTVNLEDQCNCEVLSGTLVTAPGTTTPAGADVGDIYVNTNTGTIYYWDGTSWELTSTDSQQLQVFSFNPVNNQLTLTLENGGTFNADLSSLAGDGNITSTTIDVSGDVNALLGDVILEIGDDAVTNAKLADDAVQTENILSGGNDKVLVTDAIGTVAWVDKSSFDAIADQVTITGVGTTLDPFKVEDLSIVTAKLADGAVTTIKLGDDAVTNAKLADNAVQTENILSGGNDKVLVTDAVGTVAWVDRSSFAAIADQVTITGVGTTLDPFKVEDLSIVTAKLADGAVTTIKLGDDAVTNAKLADNAVQTENILSGGNDKVLVTDAIGTVEWIDKSSFDAIADQVTITGVGTTLDPFKVEDLSIVTAKLGADAVTNAKLADNAVQTENILNGTILSEDLASGGNDKVMVTDAIGTVEWIDKSSFDAIADQVTITGVGTAADPFKVEDLSIVTAKLGADAVTNAKLADDAVQTENILSGGNDKVLVTDAIGTVAWVDKSSFDAIADQVTITGVGTTLDPFKVEDLSIVTAKLADGAVTTIKLGDDAVTNAKLADNAVQTENILSGGNDKVLVTDAVGTVAWVDRSSFAAIADQVTITGVGTTLDPFKVEDLSIVTAKLADGAVTTIKLGDDAVTNAKLADNAVQTENILSGGNDKVLVTDAVGTVAWVDKSSFAAIADQVTITGVGTTLDPFKVEDLSIVTAKLADGAVTTIKLGDDAVTNAKLADNAVQTENILSGGNDKVLVTDAVGTVAWVDRSSFAAIADQVTITGVGTTLDPFKVEDLSIVTAKLADGAVTTIKLGDDAVTNAKLADNAVQTENILSGGNDKVLVTDAVGTVAWVDRSSFAAIADQVTITGVGTTLDPFKVEDLSIVTAKLADGAVTTIKLGDDAVTNAKLADNAVQTENILNGTILTEDLASGGNDKVMVTDAIGTVEWIDKSSFDAIADQVTITGVGTTLDPFKVEDLSIVTAKLGADAVTNAKLADNAVQTENILNGTILTEDLASGGNDKVMVTDAIGTVEWIDKSSFDAIADQVTITGVGTVADPFKVEDLSIVTAKLGADAVTNAKLADNAVQTENILSGGNDKVLVTDAIGTVAWVDRSSFAAIADQVTITGVGTTLDPFKVEDLSIVTAKLADGAVTTIKLGDDAVTNAKLADNAVQTENILSGGNDKVLVTDAVGTVAWVDRSSFAAIADQVTITGVGTTLDPFKVEDLSIVTAKLADGAVTTIKLGDDAVTNAKLADNAVQTENILSGGNDKVLVTDAIGTVEWIDKSSFDAIADQVTITGVGTTLDPFKVEDLSIVTAKLGADAVTNAKLADNAVQTENILNGTILSEDLASGGNDKVMVTDAIGTVEWIDKSSFDAIADQVTITGVGTAADPFKVEDLSIVTAKLGADAVTNAKLADDAVQTENILSGGNDKVLVTDAIGTVAWVDKSSFDAIADQVTITGVGTTLDPFKVEDLSIVTAKLADGAVTTIKLGDDAVTNAKLADNAVQTENILSGGNDKVLVTDAVGTVAWVDRSSFAAIADQVTITGVGTTLDPFKVEDLSIVTAKLADGAVTTIKLGDDAVTNAKLADNAVQTENILSGGNDKVLVTDAVGTVAWVDKSSFAAIADQVTITGAGTTLDPFKVEDLSIVTAKLADGAVTTIKLGDDAVTNAKLADNAVQTENILSGGNDKVLVTDAVGTVAWVDRSSFAAIADQVTITGVGTTLDPFKVEDLSIVTAKLADGAVTTIKLGDDAVTNAKLADNAVQTENILSGGNDKVLVTDAVGTVAWVDKSSFDAIADQVTITGVGTTLDPFKVEDLSIVTAKLGADAVTNAKLADNAVQTENILNGTILTEDMASGGNDKVMVTDAVGTVVWVDKSSFDVLADQVTITGVGSAGDPFKVEDLSIVNSKLGPDAVTNAKLADDAVQLENIANGTVSGQVMQWDGTDWILIDLSSVTVTEVDGVIGNEVTNATDATLVRSGSGTNADPYTLDVSADGITNAELADNAVQTENILSGGIDKVLVTDAIGTVEWIDKSSFAAIADQVTITGVGTTLDPFKVEDLSIVTAKLGADAVTNAKLADDAVQTENILNGTILTEDMASGGNDKVMVTDAVGTVVWVDKSSFAAIADQVTITGVGTAADPFKVEDLSIVTAKLGADAVTNAKLADNAVQTENILSGGNDKVLVTDAIGTVEWIDKSSFAAIADQVTITGVGTAADPFKVEDLSIVTAKLGADAVTNAKLADNAVQTENILSGGNDKVLVTDAVGTVEWVDKSLLNSDNQTLSILGDQLTITGGNTVTVPTADGSETVVTGAGINVVTGSGTTADPYVITATEVDGSITNEVNTAFAVVGGDLSITDGNGTLTVPLSSLGTDDQNIDVLTLNATTNILTVGIENGNDLTVDLSGLVADGSETVVTGAGINVVTGSGTTADPYVITATEVDGSITNEVNTAFAVVGGDLSITDGNGTLTVPLSSLGTDDQNIDVLTLNATTNILTVGIENGNDLTVDLSGLVADGSETVVTGAGINVVTGSGTTADPYVITATEVDGSITNELPVIGSGSPSGVPANNNPGATYIDDVAGQLYVYNGATWDAVGGNATLDLDGDPTNERNTSFAVNSGNLEITDSGGTLTVPLSSLGTDDQNIDVLTLNATTNILTVGIENGNDLTVDLSGLVADGSETVVTGAGINVVTGSGTTADPYVITATEVDGSITNEVNTAFAVVGGDLSITDGNGTLTVPLASLGTDDQNIDVLTLNATTNILTVGIENGNDLTVDLSGLVADGSETVVTGAGINVVTGSGTTADPYVITATEVDGSITNEVNTAFAVVGGDLSITDGNGTLTVPLASLGTDDQNIDVLTLNATTNILTVGIENGNDLTVDLSGLVADGSETVVTGAGINVVTGSGTTADPYVITATEVDGSITNEVNTAFAVVGGDLSITDGNGTLTVPLSSLGTDDQNIDVLTLNATTNILTVGIENGNDLTVDLSGLVADGSETVVTGAGINVVTGSGTTADPYVITATEVDGSITNEVNTAFAVVGGDLSITDGNGTLTVPLSSLGTDDQNIDVLTLNATTNILTVGIENGNDLTVDLSGLVADGSETVVTGAGINVVTGSGTTADPYVITATEVDGSITNEVNTAFAVVGGDLSITDGNGTLTVPLASLGTDDQNIDVLTLNATTNILTVGIENGNDLTVDLSGLVADGSETVVTGAGINVVTGSGTTADPYVITATEVDGSITNEVNTAFAVVGGDLSITDGNGTLTVPLSSLGTDDQNIDVLTLNATTNILTVGIENGNDLTVDLSGLVADGSETVVTGAGINVVTGSGTTADPYVITATEVDGSITNEVNTAFAVVGGDLSITDGNGTLTVPLSSLGTDDQNIDVLTLNATTNILTVGIENGNDLTVDLSGLVADGSETVVTGAGINVVTGSGTTADPYVITATEVDGSITNEVNTAFAVVGGDLSITDGNGTLTVPLSSLGTDDQNIDVLTLNATTNILTVGIENGNDLTVDLSGLVADGSETVVTGAGINVVTGSGTTADPYVITATEVDGSITNEVNTAFAVVGGDLSITDGNGTLTVPLSSLGTDDQNIDVLTLNATTNILTVGIENGNDLTVDLSGLVADGSETVVTGAGINVVTGSGTTADPYVITATEVDGSITNEVNTAFAVVGGDLSITDGNGTLTVPLSSLGTDDQNIDVLTLNATTNILTVGIENGNDLTVDLSGLVADGSETVVTGAGINVVTGSGTTADPYVITATEVDGSITNEVNTAFAVVGGDLSITDGNGTLTVPLSSLGTDDQNIDVLTLNATTNILTVGIENGNDLTVDLSGLVADGSETVVTGAGINVVTGSGTTADPYVITATEVDGSITNEVNTAFAVVGGDLSITDGNGTLTVPLSSLGTDDQNIDVLTLNATTNILTVGIENGNDLTVDLSGLVADGSETVVTGAGINVVTGSGTTADPYVITATEVDGSITNEVNTAFAVVGGDLSITDGNGTLTVPLSSLGTDDQNIDVLTLNATTNILTVGIENGNDLTVDLSGLVADGSETVVTGAGINVVTGSGTTADPYVITATEVDGSITNEVNTAFAVVGGDLSITDGNGTLTVPLSSLGTDDQNIDVLTLNATTNILTVGIENGNDLTVDLSGLVADGSETVVTGAGINVVTGSGTTADPYVITATEVDGSITNEVNTAFAVVGGDLSITDGNGTLTVPLSSLGTDDQNIDVLTLNATTNILTVGIENGNDLTVDLSGLVADGSETVVTGAGINVVTGSGTTADPYVITATEVDGSITNEVNTAFAVVGGDLSITDGNGTLTVPLSSLGTDDQNIDVLTLNATTNILTVGIENGNDLTVDLSGLVADGSETVVTGAGINVVTGSGTTADPYVITATEVDGSITNEVNTAFAVVGGDLSITDGNGTLTVPLSSLGTDDQNIDVLTLNATTNILTVGIENGNDLTVDLSGLVADGSETVVTGAGINVVTGSGTTADPYVITATEVDGSITNEVNTAFAVVGGDLSITDGNGTLTVPLSSLGTDDQNIDVLTLNATTNILTVGIENGNDLTVDLSGLVADGSETVVTGAGINVVTGSGTTADPYVITATEVDGSITNEVNTAFAVVGGDLSITDGNGTLTVPLASLGTDDQNIDVLTLNATTNILTVGIENGNDLTVDLSGLVADGSETVVTGAGINVVTGSGTTADPYVITATEVDGSITNEVNTAFAVVGGDLSITDGNGTLTVPLASLGTDDQNIDVLTLNATTNILTVGIENGNDLTVDLSGLVADGSETVVTGAGINVVTGSGTTADPYVITATEVDGSITNEVNTAFAVVGGDLSITDGNGTLTVPLSSLGTDDQNIDVLTLNATTNILTVGIENGNDLTVDLSGLVADGTETIVTAGNDISVSGDGSSATPYVVANTRPNIFYPPSIAVDASSTGTGRTIDLHAQYIAQFGSPMVVSNLAPGAIPTYVNTDLYYYVTYYDNTVFANVSVDEFGEMTYDVIATPTDYNSLINVVFVVK